LIFKTFKLSSFAQYNYFLLKYRINKKLLRPFFIIATSLTIELKY
jgi:hypothetical protein